MTDTPDADLLEQFQNGSPDAFHVLVERYVALVHSVAQRHVANPRDAQDITQAVFILLARKAGTLGRKTVLPGWLYRTARLTAANFQRAEARRIRREQEAFMQSTLEEPATDALWQELSPQLDEAMASLGASERDALVLRYFQNKSVAEVGTFLGVRENTAQQRVGRALEKLRKFFAKRGVAATPTILAGTISIHSVPAAPLGLAQTISAVAIAKGAAASATITALVKATMKTMTWLKFKFAIVLGTTLLLGAGVATIAVSQMQDYSGVTPQQILTQSQNAYAALTSYSDDGKVIATIGTTKVPPHAFTIQLARPNLYRVKWVQDYGFFVQTGMVWSAGNGNFLKMLAESRPQRDSTMEDNLGTAAGISGGASSSVPGTFFKLNWGNQLGAVMKFAKRKADEKVGDVDCYVLAQNLGGGRSKTIWIGKKDFLIRQVENDTSAEALRAELEAAAKKYPQTKAAMNSVSGDVKSVETHENISLNQIFVPSDFAP